jgi:hypothetical protein
VASFAALGPYHDHHATRQVTDCDDPFFGVDEAVINHIQSPTFEDEGGILKSKAARVERLASLGRVKGYFHGIYCIPNKLKMQLFLYPQKYE